MTDKYPMLIHKITHSVDYDWWLKRLDTQLDKPTNQNPLKALKVVKPTNEKTLGTSVINSPLSPLSLSLMFRLIISAMSTIYYSLIVDV